MNILHMKYVVAVARAGSLGRASEELMIAPPNLSRSIKDLEADLGIAIFARTSKGMVLTPKGEKFIHYAKKVLNQIDDVERIFKMGLPAKRRFSISVPRASYIAEAFVQFSKNIRDEPIDVYYRETNSDQAIKNILKDEDNLGIIRYAEDHDGYFREILREKGLSGEAITEFHYVLIMSLENPIAAKKEIRLSDLRPLIEIAHADPLIPSLPLAVVKKEDLSEDIERRIFVFERGSQFDLLSENPETFMWMSPVSDKLLQRYHLVQRECPDSPKVYRDVLIHHKDYSLSDLDRQFIDEVHAAKRRIL